MKFEQTKMLLEITRNDGSGETYYTFKAPNNIEANYYHVIERKDYYVVGLYSGDLMRYYKNENKVEHVNTVTNEISIMNDRTYKIYEDVEEKKE